MSLYQTTTSIDGKAVQADRDETMIKSFITGLMWFSAQRDPSSGPCQWRDLRSVAYRWLRHVVVFTGEGAVERFVERFAVLFVSFNSGLDHLRVRGREKRWKEKIKKNTLAFRYSLMEKFLILWALSTKLVDISRAKLWYLVWMVSAQNMTISHHPTRFYLNTCKTDRVTTNFVSSEVDEQWRPS